MSENQYHHHAEQVEAARAEFLKIFTREWLEKVPVGMRVEVETETWQIFLKKRGLAK